MSTAAHLKSNLPPGYLSRPDPPRSCRVAVNACGCPLQELQQHFRANHARATAEAGAAGARPSCTWHEARRACHRERHCTSTVISVLRCTPLHKMESQRRHHQPPQCVRPPPHCHCQPVRSLFIICSPVLFAISGGGANTALNILHAFLAWHHDSPPCLPSMLSPFLCRTENSVRSQMTLCWCRCDLPACPRRC